MAHKYLSTEVGNLKYAYSFKKLVSGYSGNCVKVRRSSDDTTQDIGFSGDDLDTSSLTTFLSGSNGFIDTWYDQTSTVDLVQATASHQPRIIQEDGEWTVYFDGTSSSMQLENGASLTTATNSILHTIWKPDTTETSAQAGFQFGSSDQQFQAWNTAGQSPYIQTKTSQTYETDALQDGKWRQHAISFYNGTMTPYEMGTPMGSSASKTNPDMVHFYVGGNNTTAFQGHITEVVWIDAVKSERDIWEVSLNNYASTLFNFDNIILHIGDSLTTGIYPTEGSAWAQVLHSSLGTNYWFTQAKAGNTLGQWITDVGRLEHFGQERFLPSSNGSKTAIVWLGTNDITAGATGAVTYARYQTLVRHLKTSGFGSIIALTCLPRTESGVTTVTHATERASFNTLLKADSETALVVDLDTNSNLTDETNTTYFEGDQVHLNTAGAAEVASTVETALTNAGFNFDTQGVGNMGITFALRGDSLDARYSNAGKTPGSTGNTPAEITADQAGINGSTSIDLAGSFLTQRPLIYVGRSNLPAGKPRSVRMRVKLASKGANQGLFHLGLMTRNSFNSFYAYATTGGEITCGVANNLAQTDEGTTSGASLTDIATDGGSATWHKICCTWTGDTTANGLEVWVDGTRVLQDTMTRALPTLTTSEINAAANIIIGSTGAVVNTHFYLDEFIIDDTVVDGSAYTGDSAYISVNSFDGVAAAQGVSTSSLGIFG